MSKIFTAIVKAVINRVEIPKPRGFDDQGYRHDQ